MSTAVVERPVAPDEDTAVWRLAVASFLPVDRRAGAQRYLRYVPIGLVLAFQSFASLRLQNTAFRDEGLYVWTGYRVFAKWTEGAVLYDDPSAYFSGAYWFYPPIAAVLDTVGGLELVRLYSLVWMLAATVSVYYLGRHWFGNTAGLVGALAFALAGPVQHLGHFATFDAQALGMVAVGAALGIRALRTENALWGSASAYLFLAAILTKYVALLFVPVALALVLLSSPRVRSATTLLALRYVALTTAVAGSLLAGLVLTVARPDLDGFLSTTTTGRAAIEGVGVLGIVRDTWNFAGLWYVLAVVGLGVAVVTTRRVWLPLLLLGAAVAPAAYQAYIGEAVSLDKHLAFGLVFGSPLIGVALAQTARVWYRLAGLALVLVLAGTGLATSHRIFGEWSNTTALTDTLSYAFAAAPYLRTLGEPYEPVRFAFRGQADYWQFDTTDPIEALYYRPVDDDGTPVPGSVGSRGIEAAKSGLADGYWQVVYLDGSTGASQELEPLMAGYGYEVTDTVRLTNNRGDDTYTIWQRWD